MKNYLRLTENLSNTLQIVEEKLFNPAFNEDDFKRIEWLQDPE